MAGRMVNITGGDNNGLGGSGWGNMEVDIVNLQLLTHEVEKNSYHDKWNRICRNRAFSEIARHELVPLRGSASPPPPSRPRA